MIECTLMMRLTDDFSSEKMIISHVCLLKRNNVYFPHSVLKRKPYARLERPSYISATLVVEISVGETVVGSVVDDGKEVEHLFLPW